MLSRLYKSARLLLSTRTESSNLPTRGSTNQHMIAQSLSEPADEELTDDNSINVYVPTSSAKKRIRRIEDEGMTNNNEVATPPSSKKRKVLPVRAKNMKSPKSPRGVKHTIPVVEIPVRKILPDVEIVEDEAESSSGREEKESRKDTASASKHQRFASEELDSDVFSTAREEVVEDNKDNAQFVLTDEESDDEAPESLDIQEAAKTAKAKQREATQVVKEQLLASRNKRKERNENLRKQSASAKKRKRDLDIDAELEAGEKNTSNIADGINEVEDGVLAEINLPHEIDEQVSTHRGFLPVLLPAEYLEDTDPRDLVVHAAQAGQGMKAKKTKFSELVEKQPKDKRVGGTMYRVTKAQSTSLAPKSSFHARHTKEAWLQGRSGKAGGSGRQPVSKGFFKK